MAAELRQCADPVCENTFELGGGRGRPRKYCQLHSSTASEVRRVRKRQAEKKAEEWPVRYCEYENCDKPLTGSRAKNLSAKYCSKSCAGNERERLQRLMKRRKRMKEAAELGKHPKYTRRGHVYDLLKSTGMGKQILDRELTRTTAAERLGVSEAGVIRALEAIKVDADLDEVAEHWAMKPQVAWMFPTHLWDELYKMGPESEDTPEGQFKIDCLEMAFWGFMDRYMKLGSREEPFIVKEFHRRWVRAIIATHAWGTKTCIVSPPRHGKSEVLIGMSIWRIVMFPNIQILWVGVSTGIAKIMLGKVKAYFEKHRLLIEDTLPPGRQYAQPVAGGDSWSSEQITVQTRTAIGLKSPTLTALGATAAIPGRDVDDLYVDDLEELKTVQTIELRQKTKAKFSEIRERKTARTGFVDICSRQHPDDIPNALMERADNEGWRVLIDSAHDESCGLDEDVVDGHDEAGCVLFPEIRDYAYLLEVKQEYEDLGEAGRFEMRFLQRPVPLHGIVFRIQTIKEHCLNRSRIVGVGQMPPARLIGGIDPASRGTQAAFLWGWTEKALYMVDLEVQQAGGFAGARDVMRRWHSSYGLDTWIYEDNSGQIEFFNDLEFRNLRSELGLTVVPHTTGRNKHDPELGLTAMAPLYHEGFINLPYGNNESRQKVNALLRQLELWTTDGYAKRGKSDIKMASWLPFPHIQKWIKQQRQGRIKLAGQEWMSYPSLNGFSSMNSPPWK